MSSLPHIHSAPNGAADWIRALARALRGQGVAMHFQPIVDLQRGSVVGHEALLRFPGHAVSSPDQWFEAAHAYGCGAELEALALRMALAARADLPDDTFLSVNVAPGVITHPLVQEALLAQPSLAGVVVELTEHSRVEHYGVLAAELDRLRSSGAVIAVDDTGAGYAGLHHLVSIRPEIIKLDRTLVAGIDHDRPRRALVEMFGSFANRFGARVLAEGVETPGELATIHRLGVPLAQGYLLARPGVGWQTVSTQARSQLRALDRQVSGPTLRLLVEPVASMRATPDSITTDVATPVTRTDDVLRMDVGTGIAEAAHRALNRDAAHRFDPVLCIDNDGAFVGLVRMERIVEQLAVLAGDQKPPS